MNPSGDAQRWRRLSGLFDRALDLEPSARAVLLDAECTDDPSLRAELERMLAADASAHAFDQGPAALPLDDAATDTRDDTREIGKHLGHWLLEAVLGRGGMGTVYAARRDDRDTEQRAALKLLHRRWDGSLQAQRFLQERRILASLAHPNIPHLIDHGLDEDQRPWFALELVQGRTLIDWADAHRLDLRARLELFRKVCAAVQHAHEHFVVHRDLKPDNILVDGEGQPKVLDFGVAKRTDDVAGATRTGVFVGFTPEYAAPEQVSGGVITASTDVYALGVILYQLLAGNLPYAFDHDDLRATTETITGRSATRLDQAITTGTRQEVDARLGQRNTDLRAFRRFVKGDLSRIVQTALAKEPPRRYASVQALSADLERFLDGRTVSVSGDTFAYRARKYIGRNRWGVAMASLAALALISGTAFSAYRAHQERMQRERSEAVLAFMRELFVSEDDGAYATQLTAVQLLDRGGRRIDSAFPDDPIGKAQLLEVVAGVYATMGLHNEAPGYARRAVDLFRPYRDRDPQQYLAYVGALADALAENRQDEQVVALIDKELPFALRHDPQRFYPHLLQKRGYALKEQGALERSEADLRAAIAVYERVGEQASGTLATAYTDLALLLSDAGDSQQALELLRRAEAVHTRVGVSKANQLINQYNQARELIRMGEVREGVALLEKSIPAMDAIAGPAYSRTLNARNQLAQAYASLGRNADALKTVERNLELQRQSRTSDPIALSLTEMTQAKLLLYSGRAADALPIARAGNDFMHHEYPQPNALRGRARWILGEILLQLDRCDQALPILHSALSDDRAMSGAKATANAGEAYDSLGRCLLVRGDAKAAVEMLAKAEAQFSAALGADDRRILRSRIHRQWAEHVQAPSPRTLAAMKGSRDQLAKVMGTTETPVIWQLDLLLDPLSIDSGARLTPEQRQRIRQALARESGSETPPRFVGINSFS